MKELERYNETELEIEWVDSEKDDYSSSPIEFEITSYPADYTLEILSQKLEIGEIIIPNFQRQYVWNQNQAGKLIESFLIGLPVPPIFLYKELKTSKFLLIDGQQRLKSTKYFFEGFFGEEVKGKKATFRLNSINQKSKYYNKTFNELDDKEKIELKNRVLRAIVIQQLDPDDDTSIYHIFERLNTGGTFLNNQEVRNCVYYGTFNDLIKNKLNKYENWRMIVGKQVPDSRMTDQELILRFLSLMDVQKYEKPLKDFMSKFLKANRDLDEDNLNKIENLFKLTCDKIFNSLGEKPFNIKRGLNSSVLDCVMVAFANNSKIEIPNNIKDRFKKLVDHLFDSKLVTSGTADTEYLKKRFKDAENYLFGTNEIKNN